jgi:hypothetical protein
VIGLGATITFESISGQVGFGRTQYFIYRNSNTSVTYDHRLRRIGHPVRSAIHKPQIGRLVVGWVTTSEYLLLYVLLFALHLNYKMAGNELAKMLKCRRTVFLRCSNMLSTDEITVIFLPQV